MIMNEIWEPIVGYEGCYLLSNLGRVKSLRRLSVSGRIIQERILKLSKAGKNTLVIGLVDKAGVHRSWTVSALLKKTFYGGSTGRVCTQLNTNLSVSIASYYDERHPIYIAEPLNPANPVNMCYPCKALLGVKLGVGVHRIDGCLLTKGLIADLTHRYRSYVPTKSVVCCNQ